MDDDQRVEKKNQKEMTTISCCTTATGAQILKSSPVQEPIHQPCCENSAGGTITSEESLASPVHPKFAFMNTSFWLWGIAGLTGITILILSAGFVPGIRPEIFWREIISNLAFVGKAVWSILPFFLLGVGIAAWVTVSGFSERIKAVFYRREKIAIAGAAIVGATIPLCSCGVIPLIAALLASGVPLAPVMAFWISSPLMGPSMFVLTAGVLGIDFALARLVTAVFLGAGAGYIIYFLSASGLLNNQLHGLSLSQSSCCGSEDKTDSSGSKFWSNFWPEALKVSLFLGKWLLIAFILESLIVHYVDPSWISAALGKNQLFSIPLATAIGIPVYTSGVGAIPIVDGLLKNGMSHDGCVCTSQKTNVCDLPWGGYRWFTDCRILLPNHCRLK